jgi:hypothetical protein
MRNESYEDDLANLHKKNYVLTRNKIHHINMVWELEVS